MMLRKLLLFSCFFVPLLTPPVTADDLPLYEFGAGIGGLNTPHYLGSDQNFSLLVPLPYFVYRGEHFQADRSGVRTVLFDNERLDLSLSLAGGLPVDSDDNDARAGMPDLDLFVEAGPVLRYIAYRNEADTHRVRLEFPLRAAFSVDDLSLRHQGWTSTPSLQYQQLHNHWLFSSSLVAMLGDRSYHGYFYDVDSAYVTPERDYYRAKAGFTAAKLTFSLTRQFSDIYVAGFVSYYNLANAANTDSPLVRRDDNLAAGFMAVWLLGKSGKTGARLADDPL